MKQQTAANKGGIIIEVDPKLITLKEGFNVRHDYGDIEELMKSIIENGLKTPLRGHEEEGKFILTDGHRRYMAISKAIEKGNPIKKVPFIIEEKGYSDELRTLDLIICNDGKPLTMLEQSEVIGRLLRFKWNVKDVVQKTGKARGYIENLILLTKAPVAVQNYMKEEKISAHAVIQIINGNKKDESAVIAATEEAIENAKSAGKEKATPKHIDKKGKDEKDNKKSIGSFQNYMKEISGFIIEMPEEQVDTLKQDVLVTLLFAYEKEKSAKRLAVEYFKVEPKKGRK